MRGLAAHLGVTPMALYNHVSDKADLLREIATQVIDGVEFDRPGLGWRDRIEHCFSELRLVCRRHPYLMSLVETTDIAPASVFAPMNAAVDALREAGLNDLDALRTYFMLVHFTLGQVGYEVRGPFADLEPTAKNRSERIAGRGYTTLERLEVPEDWDFDAAFEFGLQLVLDGIENRGVAAPRRSAS